MYLFNYFKAVRFHGPITFSVLCWSLTSVLLTSCVILSVDEPEEVEYVKKALAEHLDLDPQVTLGVLCDQIVPLDEPMDEEDQIIRERLRSLVISFLTGRAKRAIVERHVKPGSEAEGVLVGGLLMVRYAWRLFFRGFWVPNAHSGYIHIK
jgi:hypothetical protein